MAVHRVAQNRTGLTWLSTHECTHVYLRGFFLSGNTNPLVLGNFINFFNCLSGIFFALFLKLLYYLLDELDGFFNFFNSLIFILLFSTFLSAQLFSQL